MDTTERVNSSLSHIDDDDDSQPVERLGISTLIIDNYDSYTYNLYQMVLEADSANNNYNNVMTIPSNKFSTIASLSSYLSSQNFPPPSHPNLTIIISPGPGDPRKDSDLGISADILRGGFGDVPVLGVCLGHQVS